MQDYSPPPASADQASGGPASQSSIEVFLSELLELHCVPHLVQDAKQTVDTLRAIVAESEPKSVVVAGLPAAAKMLVETALKGVKHRFVEELKGPEVVQFTSKSDLGITWAQFGAAKQGCIFEVAFDDAVKLASSLPRTHIALLSSKDLLPDLPTALERVGSLLREDSLGQRRPVVSIISGPSKTADIEMRLTYGVHGPHTLHVILLDWL